MKDKDAQDAIKELKCLSTKSKKVDMDRVNNLFDKLLSDDNKNEGSKVVAYIKRASNLYEQHGLFDKAIADYKAAIKIYNGSKNKRSLYYNFCYANLRLGSIYGKLENYNVSASFLGEAIKHPSYSDKANYEWGRNYLRKGDAGSAMHYFNKIDKNGINKQYYYFGVADAFMLKGDIQGALNIFNEGINNNCYECYGGVLCYYIKTGNKECFLNVMNRLHSLNAFIPTIYLAYEYVYTNNDEKFSLLSTSNYSALQIFKYSSDRAVEHILEYSDSKLLGNDRMVKTFVEKSSEILDGIKPIDTLDIVDFYDISFACLPETTYRVSTLPNDKSKVLTVYILNHPSGSFSEKRSLVRKRI